jgi:polyphosphate kinase
MEHNVSNPRFFDRDISWLKFNDMVLEQAAKAEVPLLERLKFLAIFSSNLDEFYRVRMPILTAMDKIVAKGKVDISATSSAAEAADMIAVQLEKFGKLLTGEIITQLKKNNIIWWYNMPPDEQIFSQSTPWFYSQVMAFLRPVYLSKADSYPKNSRLYFLVILKGKDGREEQVILNIPSDKLPRFYSINEGNKTHVVFIDDVIRYHLPHLFKGYTIHDCYSFKITRDAKLDLKDEYDGDVANEIEKQIEKREFGLATRFLYQPGIPLRAFEVLINQFEGLVHLPCKRSRAILRQMGAFNLRKY